MAVGDLVFIRTENLTYNALVWTMCSEVDAAGKFTLAAEVEGATKHIRVAASKTFPTTMALKQEIGVSNGAVCLAVESCLMKKLNIETLAENNRWEINASEYLDKWVPLPLLGGNYVMLRREPDHAHEELILFPRLNSLRLELWFYSTWYQGCIRLIQADGFKPCPMQQIWPFCAWCRKFHLPHEGPGSHRNSKKHKNFESWLACGLCDAPTMREQLVSWSRDMFWICDP